MATCRVLVVDDDAVILDLVAEVLMEMGFAVDTAAGGAEALSRRAHTDPAVLLLDLRMPQVSGWDVARALQEAGRVRPCSVVMTAAQDARVWAHDAGATRDLTKPFDLSELLDAVEQACAGVSA